MPKSDGTEMIFAGDWSRQLQKNSMKHTQTASERIMSREELRAETQQLSLREQLERNHFLLKRLYAASAGIISAVEDGDVHAAIGEILGNLIGSEEVAIFHYHKADRRFAHVWSTGLSDELLGQLKHGTTIMRRTVDEGMTQFRELQINSRLEPSEEHLTASIILKSSRQVVGVILIFGLLPQKNGLEWVDYELLKFLETYGAVAIQLQSLQKNVGAP